jgi:tRNA (Thr-GGU) A37 N-methylase
VTVTALEGLTGLRVGALEAIDGTPLVDLKIAMRERRKADPNTREALPG